MANLVLPNGKGHGWKRDTPSHRDKYMRDRPTKVAITGPVGFLDRGQHPAIRDQGSLGSCTGHGTRTALQTQLKARGKEVELSPLYIYWRGREKEACIPEDSGCEIRDVIWATANFGAAREECWPYRVAKFAKTPTQTAHKSALSHQVKVGYYKCRSVDDVLQAMAQKMPVVGGFSCFSDSFDRADGYIPMPSQNARLDGGHCVCYLSADPGARTFTFANSWSKEWGSGGYGTMPFEWMERGLMNDCWAIDHE